MLVLSFAAGCNSLRAQADEFAPNPPDGAPSPAEGTALCGGQGEPCCQPPLPACMLGLECDARGSACLAVAPACDDEGSACSSSAPSRLCRTDGDCAAGESCCPAGALGVCVALETPAECPRSDLAIALRGAGAYQTTSQLVEAGSCALGCFDSPGSRRILGVSLRLFNVGDVDAVLGTLDAPGTAFGCEPYVENALIYELRAEDGTLVRQLDARLKPGCVADDPADPTGARFSCEMLGLEHGSFDDAAAGCAGLDISGVPDGRYTLGVRLELDPDVFPDSDPSNNRLDLPVTLLNAYEPDPTSACPDGGELLITEEPLECGWTAFPIAECRPGEPFVVSCPECSGEMLVRLCEGDAPCTSFDAFVGDEYGAVGACPVAGGTCPESGLFTALVSPVDAGASYRCDLRMQLFEPDPLVPCSQTPASDSLPERDCSWTVALTDSCVPGERVAVGCPDACDGSPVLRVCSGDGACRSSSDEYLGTAEGHTEAGLPTLCPVVSFVCPPQGTYATLVTPTDTETAYSCELARVDALGPTDPCSDGVAAGWFTDQSCGWLLVSDEACTPGQSVDVECVLCSGAPDLRVCDGSEVCIPRSPRELTQGFSTSEGCPGVSFDCPASGRYSVWATPFDEVESDVCTILPPP